MRLVIILPLLITALCSCEQKSASTISTQNQVQMDSIYDTLTARIVSGQSTNFAWNKQEDSLRNEILNGKKNKTLKESFLVEMYIRNVVKVSNDSLLILIPFNLHGADCGAPDCYSTNISFSFKLGDTLLFPQNLQFQERELGCIEKEKPLFGSFQLLEQSDKHIIYHSTKLKRTLVLFSSNMPNGTTAFYFTGVGRDRINGKNVYDIMRKYNEEDKNSIYPFTSWVLTTNEYENFIK